MKDEEYKMIVNTIRSFQGLSRDCAKMLVSMYSRFQPITLYSILSLEVQRKMKLNHWQLFGKNNTDYYGSYLEAARMQEGFSTKSLILVKMAAQLQTCPVLLARKVLEQYCRLKDEHIHKHKINKMMKDTTLIKDKSLAYEIYMCLLYDDQYGSIADAMNDSVGEEYEVKLQTYLMERNVPFYNEIQLRAKGYDKTPDCKLEIPIAVNGFVVNWIESKAQFGCNQNHETYIKEQFLSYWNRFGPGLVVYWFGFVESIVESSETRFIVMDHIPENITYMNPTSIRQ